MSASVLQEPNNSPAGNGGTITQAITTSAVAASRWVIMVGNSGLGTHNSVTDGAGNTYTKRDDITTTGGLRITSWTAVNCSNNGGSADTITGTFQFSAAGNRAIYVAEVGGVKSSGFDGHIAADQATPGTATDGVSTGSGASSTNANKPAIVLGFSIQIFWTGALSSGTGFTPGASAGTWGSGTGSAFVAQNKRILTSASAQAATFTTSNNSECASFLVIFDEFVPGSLLPSLSNQGGF